MSKSKVIAEPCVHLQLTLRASALEGKPAREVEKLLKQEVVYGILACIYNRPEDLPEGNWSLGCTAGASGWSCSGSVGGRF